MKLFPIRDPVAGEQVLAVQPQIARFPDADWRQRLEYFSGRALTHTALRLEQYGRAGHLATLGQALSPGVVTGLEAVAATLSNGVVLEISAGMGLAASGEIISLNRNHQVRLDDIRVYAPASLLDSTVDTSSGEGAYKLGDTLAELRTAGKALPQAMILVLQPVVVEHFGMQPSTDPCDYDPSNEAFENWQWLDGFRLLLYTWPSELGALPLPGAWRRNRIAHAIFEQERLLSEGEFLPWFDVGVPVALIGLNTALEFEFIDNNAVLRRGAEVKGGGVPISSSGNRFLWQARLEQFNEQLVDWLTAESSLDPAQIRAEMQFRYLPPVGVLPKQCMSPRQQLQHFFPMSYAVRALAVPYEQLDLAIEESASLLSYDLNTPDQVEVLVPVPQAHYEPQLLKVEEIDDDFDTTITRFTLSRNQWLGRRAILRNRASTLYHAIKGTPLLYPADDPNASDSLEQAIEFEQQPVKAGDTCHFLKGQAAPPGNWFQNSFDDRAWTSGITSIGYGITGLGTTLADMNGQYVTLFLRHRFNIASIAEAHRYTLTITSSGGFYAYLNGSFLNSANVKRPLFNAPAIAALSLETRRYELGELSGRLLEGENVLAIQAHNSAINAASFSISIALLDTEEEYGTKVKSTAGVDVPFGHEQYEVSALAELRSFLDTSTPLSDAEVARLDEIGIEQYVDFLQSKIDQADDHVEFGFLRLRTDIYRVRQMMLGNEAGTKLATSPALAEIAKGASAVATKSELSDFYKRLKQPGPVVKAVTKATDIGGSEMIVKPMAITAKRNLFFSGELAGNIGATIPVKDNIKTIPNILVPKKVILRESSAALFDLNTAKDVGEQNPVVGKVQDFNKVTVGERLEESSANVAHMAGYAVKAELISNLLNSGINIDDLSVPGIKNNETDEKLEILPEEIQFPESINKIRYDSASKLLIFTGAMSQAERTSLLALSDDGLYRKAIEAIFQRSNSVNNVSFAHIRADRSILSGVLAGDYDRAVVDDESGFFNAGVKAMESVVGVLRLIEGRVQAYRRAVESCKSTMSELQNQLGKLDSRLKTVANELAESRHDVTVARSLKAEEQSRIDALNAKRDKVLETLVPFLLFRRPRSVDPRRDAPLHYVNPDLSDQPLPLCDLSEVEAPDALEAMLDVVRDAPLMWFAAVKLIMPHLSRLADLHVTLSGAKKRAASKVTVHPFMKVGFDGPDKMLQGLGAALTMSQQRIQLERRKTTAIDLAAFQRLGWQESIKRVPEVISLGDLIDGNHGRMAASQRATDEMAMFAKVATCLYLRFSAVPASIRLDWAERLSQYDAPANLRNLYNLPRFGEMDFIARNNMQRLVDWLYSRIVIDYSEAQHMVSDLIRVALLSASHAPVNQLIAGHLPAAVTVRPGSRFSVVADLTRVRIGMSISMISADATLVRGRVADISGGQVTAEVHTVVGTSVQLGSGTRVQIGERLGMMF